MQRDQQEEMDNVYFTLHINLINISSSAICRPHFVILQVRSQSFQRYIAVSVITLLLTAELL